MHCILIFFFSSFIALSQTKVTVERSIVINSESSTDKLSRYLWSYAKYTSEKNKKPILNFETLDSWQELRSYISISNDGKYFAYSIGKNRGGWVRNEKLDSLIVQSTSGHRRWVFVGAKPGFFAADNKLYVFQVKDSLCFLPLDGRKATYVTNVQSYKVPDNGVNKWILYQLKTGNCSLILQNLISGIEKRFCSVSRYELDKSGEWLACYIDSDGSDKSMKDLLFYQFNSLKETKYSSVEDYFVSKDGMALVLKSIEAINDTKYKKLKYVSLAKEIEKTIWATNLIQKKISNVCLDKTGKQVAFTIQDSTVKSTGTQIWYYREGMDTSIVKGSNKIDTLQSSFRIHGPLSFTDNGNYIQFQLQAKSDLTKLSIDAVKLDIWSYKDKAIRATKSTLFERNITVTGVISTINERIILLEKEGRKLCRLQGDYAIVKKLNKVTHGDRFWEKGYNEDSCWLISLIDGKSQLLPFKVEDNMDILWFSPGEKYLVYIDVKKGCQYYSYDLRKKEVNCMSSNITPNELGYASDYLSNLDTSELPLGIAAWLQNDQGLLMYGKNDIWLADLTGKRKALNVTKGYGRSNNMVFSLFTRQRLDPNDDIPILKKDISLLISAFSITTRYNGFYKIVINENGDPKLLSLGPYFFHALIGAHDRNLSNKGMQPLKARDANVWIVQRQSASDAPNYYKTNDFKSFAKLTDYQPHEGINWLSQELHSFQHMDGKFGQGILFKPENFDSSKRYPVVIIFYGNYSNNLYQFPVPAYNSTAISTGQSPIWFLSNGYLVFTPDIYVTPLKYGVGAFNVIEGAARYLKQLSYVNGSKLACASHSWSAKLGAYIFTHSNSFSAMAISEGYLYANLINVAFSIGNGGGSHLETVEKNFRFGNLYINKDSWLDQTTIINADRAKSPLLLLCNNQSSQEYQNQTLQLYTALRRLEKKVWWLKYDKGSHVLDDRNEMKDFTIRYTQYFDHYLKDAPAPIWMTQGMPDQLYKIEDCYGLDPAGSCALTNNKDCPICRKWNEKYKKNPEMFNKPISEWVPE